MNRMLAALSTALRCPIAVVIICVATLLLGAEHGRAEGIAALGTGMTFETSTDGRTIETRQPFSVRGGYRFPWVDTYLEFNTFHTSSGNPTVFITREHDEWLLWGTHAFRKDWPISPFVGAGLGIESERVTTSLGAESSRDGGDPQSMAAAVCGLRSTLWKTLDLALESRLSFASHFQPNPLFGLGVVAGYLF